MPSLVPAPGAAFSMDEVSMGLASCLVTVLVPCAAVLTLCACILPGYSACSVLSSTHPQCLHSVFWCRMFREKWNRIKSKINELQQQHFQEPANAEYCVGQKLQQPRTQWKKPQQDTAEYTRSLSYHCYDPTCPQNR